MPKSKPWREMTDLEIAKIKKKKCIHCIYHGGNGTLSSTTGVTCDYILYTGFSRGCRPDDCIRYKMRTGEETMRRIDNGH